MPNYAILSIPFYYILSMAPHALSISHLSKCTPSQQPPSTPSASTSTTTKSHAPKYDNANPRGSAFQSKLASLSPRDRATYERLRAAHANMTENMAFYAGAVLAGVAAGVEGRWLNRMLAVYLVSRVVYLGLYWGVEGGRRAFWRTACYNAGCVVLMGVYWGAAVALG